ncbi:MAG: hydroxyisourate hydrolase [Nitriliruptor sp.]|uniref:hydroxyisourate hydrolase n=1 Tax=Nitriliruptor sp. TaxID=2448056 RepID=UPI0034A09752
MSLSTHVLDTSRGVPATGVEVTLERSDGDGWTVLTEGRTDGDGRIGDLVTEGELTSGVHRLTFATAGYCDRSGVTCFFPEVIVTFAVTAPDEHHHVPLLLSPFGYSTYRGS